MSNDPSFRDLSHIQYLEYLDEVSVARIEKISVASAAALGLFGLLYFSLAPSAQSSVVEISSTTVPGSTCKMLAKVSMSYDPFLETGYKEGPGIVPLDSRYAFLAESKGSKIGAILSPAYEDNWQVFFPKQMLIYRNTLFNSYSDCLSAAKVQTKCVWSEFAKFEGQSDCNGAMKCSGFGSDAYLSLQTQIGASITFSFNQSVLDDPKLGACPIQAQPSSCFRLEACAGLEKYIAAFTELVKKYILTPELLCEPFLNNPPYACVKSVPLTIPSILSQSFAFASSALAASKLFMLFLVKYFRKVPKTECELKPGLI
jgi:hypothetical protein